MKGIIFTEFLDLVEQKFGLEMVDKIISQSKLVSNGYYTAVGTYSFSEMLQLLQNLNLNTDISINKILLAFAEHFFSVLVRDYPTIIASYADPIEMISSIENHIHVEVRKIYPDAELPTFTILEKCENYLTLIYKSSRAMHYFGLGLMKKAFEYYNSSANIDFQKIKNDGTEVKFTIQRIS